MSGTTRALDDSLELILRFATQVDAGLLAGIRARRRHRQPWEPEDQASRDLRRIGALVRQIHAAADELTRIAARYEERESDADRDSA